MTAHQLLRWLLCHDKVGLGVPMDRLSPEWVESLRRLHETGNIHITTDPPLVWVDPGSRKERKRQKRRTNVYVESDLPSDVPMLKHLPDRDSAPVKGLKLNGEPIYRPRDEPSELIAMGGMPWPLEGTTITPRWYRPARAKWTTEEIRDLVVTSETCPVCGSDGKRNNPRCLVCDCWPHNYPKTVRTLEAEPEPEKVKKPRKKGAKAG